MARKDTLKHYEIKGGWMIPCCECKTPRLITDRSYARKSLKLMCRECGNKAGAEKRTTGISVYDCYKLEEGKWNVPCFTCGAERFYTEYTHVGRAVRKHRDCKSCSNSKHRTKPENINLPYTRGKLLFWARQVKERDGCCQMCGSTENLEAHHLVPKALIPDYALVLGNGIALCNSCHKDIHKEIGKPRSWA